MRGEAAAEDIRKMIVLSFLATLCVARCAEMSGNIEAFDEREIRRNDANLNEFEGGATGSKILGNFRFGLNAGAQFKFGDSRSLVKRSPSVQDDSIGRAAVINNIQIIVSENASKSGIDKCENGICNISVSSKTDNEGNIITDVRLNLITKLPHDSRNNDEIPVINGIRGLGNSNRTRSSVYNFYNIPQIQSRYQGGEPWYQGRRIFQRPEIKPIIDDKIEPPFSRT